MPALLTLLCIITSSTALAGWTIPTRISNHGAYMPRLAYSGGILHAIYYDWSDDATYVRSTDLGRSWLTPIDMSAGWSDYPEICASGNSVVAMWLGDGILNYHNYVFRKSTNGGGTWSDTAKIFANNRSDIHSNFSICTHGGKIYCAFVSYQSERHLSFTKSTDFGTSWSSPISVYSIYSIDNLEIMNYLDTLYVIFNAQDTFAADYEVYFTKSTDGGQAWSTPAIISLADSGDSYHPRLAVSEQNDLAVCWGASGGAYRSDILVRLSHDGGNSWGDLIEADIKGWVDKGIAYSGDTLNIASGGGNIIRHTISVDGGASWAPVDSVEENRYQSYDPEIAVTPGMIHVIWDDRRVHNPGIYYSRWEEGYIPPDSSIPPLNMVGTCTPPYWTNWYPNLCIAGDYAFISGSTYLGNSIQVVDKSNPATPEVINTFDTLYYPCEMAVKGDYLYFALSDDGGLISYNIANLMNPVLAFHDPRGYDSHGICIRDTLLYLVNTADLSIYNIADPFAPVRIAIFDSIVRGYALNDVDVKDGIACLVASRKLFVVDVTDPTSPTIRSQYAIDDVLYDGLKVAIKGDYAYVITYSPEVEIVNISDPLIRCTPAPIIWITAMLTTFAFEATISWLPITI